MEGSKTIVILMHAISGICYLVINKEMIRENVSPLMSFITK